MTIYEHLHQLQRLLKLCRWYGFILWSQVMIFFLKQKEVSTIISPEHHSHLLLRGLVRIVNWNFKFTNLESTLPVICDFLTVLYGLLDEINGPTASIVHIRDFLFQKKNF